MFSVLVADHVMYGRGLPVAEQLATIIAASSMLSRIYGASG